VFRGLLRALARLGYAGLSFAALGDEVGLSASALHQRFGSKAALLRAFIEWNNARAREAVQARRREGRAPLETIRAVLGDWGFSGGPSAIGPGQAARVFSLYSELAADPVMREPIRARIALLLDVLERLLGAAVDAGELAPCDAPHMARALLAGAAGTMLLALLTRPEGSLEEQVRASVDATLAPYLRERARSPHSRAGGPGRR
jgi:AcrR family transcriptional regulator